jgi:protein-tyrosine-phosphatase
MPRQLQTTRQPQECAKQTTQEKDNGHQRIIKMRRAHKNYPCKLKGKGQPARATHLFFILNDAD